MKKKLIFGVLLSGFLFSNQVEAAEIKEEPKAIEFKFDGTTDEIIKENIIVRELQHNPHVFNERVSIMGAGVWDYLGESTFSIESSVFPSNGGDYMVSLIHPKDKKAKFIYELKEQDPLWSSTVERFTIEGPGEYYEVEFRGISGWLDGDDNQAEFFLSKLAPSFTTVSAGFWD